MLGIIASLGTGHKRREQLPEYFSRRIFINPIVGRSISRTSEKLLAFFSVHGNHFFSDREQQRILELLHIGRRRVRFR
jgi:hypothetical protein